MMERCTNPKHDNFRYYGGRGITVCERWKLVKNFYADMGKAPSLKHSLNRIDNNKGYEPSNCIWSTMEEQNNNKRNNETVLFQSYNL
jgi:hypothetical protein